MKKNIFIILGVMAIIMVTSLPGYARGPHFHSGASVWIGPGWGVGWGPGWGPGWVAPVYPRYYPYYPPAASYAEPPPAEYYDPAPLPEQPEYWYYCKKPKGYYPYVRSCPDGWTKVAPNPDKPAKEE